MFDSWTYHNFWIMLISFLTFVSLNRTALYPATTAAGAFKAEPVFDLVQSTLKTVSILLKH